MSAVVGEYSYWAVILQAINESNFCSTSIPDIARPDSEKSAGSPELEKLYVITDEV